MHVTDRLTPYPAVIEALPCESVLCLMKEKKVRRRIMT
jgi:hypothetical protein